MTERDPRGRTYRLPTEAEWEFACRGGDGRPAAWAGGDGTPDAVAWHAGNSGGRVRPTGGLRPNGWGFRDMHGNAAEWCLDDYHRVYPSTEFAPLVRDADAAPKVVRGGSCLTPGDQTRSAARAWAPPDDARADLGFRVVREVPPSSATATTRP
jgi:formylglycine-generating enzyme required for sulfatase activity